MKRLFGVGIAALMVLLVLLCSGVVLARCTCDNNDCFDDLTITEAGIDIVRGTYHLDRMNDGKAWFENDAGVRIYHNGTEWVIASSGGRWYVHMSDQDVTPPASGWVMGLDGDLPLPRVSQSTECGGPPEITWVRFSTNPWDGQWITPDKTVTLRFVSSKLLGDTQVTIMGQPATFVSFHQYPDRYQWDFRYMPGPNDPEGPVTFTIDYEDIEGRAGPRITEDNDIVETFLYSPYCDRGCPDGFYVYDRTPPTVPTRLIPEDDATVRDSRVTLMWMESTDALSGLITYHLTVRADDGSYEIDYYLSSTSGTRAYTIYNLAEGTYTWDVSGIDYAGNESDSGGAGTFTLDVPNGELIVLKPLGYVSLEEGAGCLDIITVGLSEAPVSDVFVVLEWDDQISSEGSEPTTSLELTFTPTSWEAVPVCLYAVDDDAYEGWHAVTIWGITVSSDFNFDALDTATMISIVDNDPLFQGVTVGPADESGNTLDIGIPEWMVPEGEDPLIMEGYVLAAAIEIGTPITGGVAILTAFGRPLVGTICTAVLQQLLIEEGEHSLVEVASQSLFYDLLRNGFFVSLRDGCARGEPLRVDTRIRGRFDTRLPDPVDGPDPLGSR